MGKKKGKCLWLLAVLLVVATPVFAIDLTAGVDTEFNLGRDIKGDNTGLEGELTAQYYDVKVDVPLGDIIKLSPKVGIQTFGIETDVPFVGNTELNGGVGFNIGIDAESKALETKYVDLSLVGSYRFSRNDVDEVDLGGIVIDNPIETILTTHEWEIGIKGSKDLTELTGIPLKPYIGIVYSDLRGNIDANLSVVELREDIKAEDNLGLRLGIGYEPIANLNLGIGVKLVDQTAIMAGGTYRF